MKSHGEHQVEVELSQPFLLLLGGISTYCAPGTRKVLNFVEERVTRLGENIVSHRRCGAYMIVTSRSEIFVYRYPKRK